MISGWLELTLLSLATFRLTRLIVFDKITSFIRKPFHEEIEEVNSDGEVINYIEIKGNGFQYWIGELLSCYWCTGIWCAAVILGITWLWPAGSDVIITLLAIAGAAAIIESIIQRIME